MVNGAYPNAVKNALIENPDAVVPPLANASGSYIPSFIQVVSG
jgi:hypothetical protein